VLRATTRTGEVIIKRHRSPQRHRQELHAYQHWTPALHGRAPRLLAVSDDPPAIVITALPGSPLATAGLTTAQEVEAHCQAGELLRVLHDSGPAQTEPDMTAWLAERGEQWLTFAVGILPAARRAEIRAHLRELAQLGPIPAVPCHLDYTPRNLLATATGQVAVIDFEHARYDLAARDLVRLATRTWPARPDLEEAFLHEYGPISEQDRHVIEHCSHLDALTAAVSGANRSRRPV
jgi:Ser/Thr protein kinase RdoA (MazF antagonist)